MRSLEGDSIVPVVLAIIGPHFTLNNCGRHNMSSITTAERVDLLASCLGLVTALVLTMAGVGQFFGAAALSFLCLWAERAGVVLALLGGTVHTVVLWRRFGFFKFWYSFKDLYGSRPRQIRLFSFGVAVVGAVSFAVLIATRDSGAGSVSAGYTALVFSSFLLVWFSLILAQIVSLIDGARPSAKPDAAR